MSTRQQTICDACHIVKRDNNNWFRIAVGTNFLSIHPQDAATPIKGTTETFDLCGLNCVLHLTGALIESRFTHYAPKPPKPSQPSSPEVPPDAVNEGS